jgi:hypothetical protein
VGSGINTAFVPNPAVVGAGNIIAYGGQRMPDVVGNLRVDQAWGSAQIAGAVHQMYVVNRVPVGIGVVGTPAFVPNLNAGTFVDTEYGFAITAGVKVNMPMIAPGDVFWLQATYADGAINYAGFGGALNQGRVTVGMADAIVDALGNLKRTEAWNIHAAFLHYWTPQIRQAIFGTYGQIEVGGNVGTVPLIVGGVPLAGVGVGSFIDADYWQVGTNLIWSPVRDLDIGVEVLYRNVDPKGRVLAADPAGRTWGRFIGDEGTFEGRLRIQRDF